MPGRSEKLMKVNQNTFSVYVAPVHDLQNALISGPIRSVHSTTTYLFFGGALPLISLPPDLQPLVNFRKIEGLCGLLGAVTHDDSSLLFIQYARELLEEEDAHRALADVCRSHARDIAPVIILSTTHDAIIDNLGQLSDRYVILKKTRKSGSRRRKNSQKTLDDWESLHTSPIIFKRVQQYGQQTLPAG